MKYPLENLGHERFQELCQALLTSTFPTAQCFPVGEADGGRDATSISTATRPTEFIVYQVKFVRRPLAENNPRKWLADVLKAEIPKVAKLIPKGATKYYLLTNIQGSGALDSGSIDTIDKLLNTNVGVPAQCWWRDDIERRLDNAWNIKWEYPEVLSNHDFLRIILEHDSSGTTERRASAIQTFLRDQFEEDKEVRFKQVELKNELLDLFIDVPINLRQYIGPRGFRPRELGPLFRIADSLSINSPGPSAQSALSCATLLLHPYAQSNLPRLVIEGAPGQGKSTIVQYVCQIHRQRLLHGSITDDRVPPHDRNKPIRLPFRIDCRHLDKWLDGGNPFPNKDLQLSSLHLARTLESFLATQIATYSGGATFAVDDVHAVARRSAILIVFDGLDEVADIDRRRDVVNEIIRGTRRLESLAPSLQTVVTSRPAALANAVAFPDNFTYIQLASISTELIKEYTNKWAKAGDISDQETSDIHEVLTQRIEQPHFGELAKNPMQLSILLSLIHTRGTSLPDKRTILYDKYIDLFFNREAEKSDVVRDNRDLLINIHRYLAWILHSEAQGKQTRGSISKEELLAKIGIYLKGKGHPSDLADKLLDGMVERVVAIVSRVEGTYEFEVQPLREYFAARHLYETIPYAPAADRSAGTLPDRFDALSRDFFWQNVTRFYAGCYSDGQLESLVESIRHLADCKSYDNAGYTQSTAMALLSDSILSLYPNIMRSMIDIVLKGVRERKVVFHQIYYRANPHIVLPKNCGNEELVHECFRLLLADQPADVAQVLLGIIDSNVEQEEATGIWKRYAKGLTGPALTRWIVHGYHIDILNRLPKDYIQSLFHDKSELGARLDVFVRSGNTKFVEEDEELLSLAICRALEGTYEDYIGFSSSAISAFVSSLFPDRYAISFESPRDVPLSTVWEHEYHFFVRGKEAEDPPLGEVSQFRVAKQCQKFVATSDRLRHDYSAIHWATRLDSWNELVESGRVLFGDRWALYALANISAGIRSKDTVDKNANFLYDVGVPLCRRTRFARLRAGNARWWEEQLISAKTQNDLALGLLVLLTWGGPTVLRKLGSLIDRKLGELDGDHWRKLIRTLSVRSYHFSRSMRRSRVITKVLPEVMSERFVAAIGPRIDPNEREAMCDKHLRSYDGDDGFVTNFRQQVAVYVAETNPKDWKDWLPQISKYYLKGATVDRRLRYGIRGRQRKELPLAAAREIVENREIYPMEFISWAEHVYRLHVVKTTVPVAKIAERDRWVV